MTTVETFELHDGRGIVVVAPEAPYPASCTDTLPDLVKARKLARIIARDLADGDFNRVRTLGHFDHYAGQFGGYVVRSETDPPETFWQKVERELA